MFRFLRVNMATKACVFEEIPQEYAGLGGRALTSTIVAREVPPTCTPIGPHIKLVFAPGLLGATNSPNANRISVGCKSPLTEGIKVARSILASPVFDPVRGPEILPGPGVNSDAEILAYLRAEALTVYHPVGTAKMGTDDMAVVDPESLKVRGLANLRVADASIMPTLIGGNTNAPCMMVGDKAADAILGLAG